MVGSIVFRIGLYFKRIRNILKTNINEYTGRCFWNMISEFISNIVTDQLGKCTPDRSSKLDKYKRDFGQSTLPAMSEKRNNRKHCQKAWLSKRLFGQNVQANDFLIVVSSYPFRYFDHRRKKKSKQNYNNNSKLYELPFLSNYSIQLAKMASKPKLES